MDDKYYLTDNISEADMNKFRMNTINPQLGYSETSFFNTLIYDIFK